MKLFIAHSAYADFEDILAHYRGEGVPQIGTRFVASIIEHVQTLVEQPDIGRVVPEFCQERIRELIHPPFRVVYLREADAIHVIRVWRSERLLRLPDQRG